jgi:hypothetical protein
MNKKKKILDNVIEPCNRVARVITIIGEALYASVRLVLLSLASCALSVSCEIVPPTLIPKFELGI